MQLPSVRAPRGGTPLRRQQYAALALYAQKLAPQAADPALSRFCCGDATAEWPHLAAQSAGGKCVEDARGVCSYGSGFLRSFCCDGMAVTVCFSVFGPFLRIESLSRLHTGRTHSGSDRFAQRSSLPALLPALEAEEEEVEALLAPPRWLPRRLEASTVGSSDELFAQEGFLKTAWIFFS